MRQSSAHIPAPALMLIATAAGVITLVMFTLHVWASTPVFEYCDADFCAGSLQELDALHAAEQAKCAPWQCK